jgi:gliding motility-associated-like protein
MKQNLIYNICFLLSCSITLCAQVKNSSTEVASLMKQNKALKAAFEENKGQVWDMKGKPSSEVQYHYKEAGMDIFMLERGIAYQFSRMHYPEGYVPDDKDLNPEEREAQDSLREKIRVETFRMDMQLVNANENARIIAEGESAGYVQYYNRNTLNVHSFQKLTYKEVWPGIDWVIYTTDEGLKYDFIVHPGADPAQIQMQFSHHEGIKINEDGSFTLSSAMGTLTEQAPVSFQGDKRVATSFVLEGDVIRFELGNYDSDEVLIVDPDLIWASYYGGSNGEDGNDCAVDGSGNVYLVGWTGSGSNIASGGHQDTIHGGRDAFIVKFNSSGTRLWASYYGGYQNWNGHGNGCSVDASGNVYLVGSTPSSSNIAFGGHQNTSGGHYDAFIVKFNSSGTRLWASYYGGSDYDSGYGCSVDGSGNVYLVGSTSSTSNIASGGHQNSFGGGGSSSDAFIVKFNSSGTRLWASYYGGSGWDEGYGCTVDSNGNVYMVGLTSASFNIASGGHQNTIGGNRDAFIVKFNSSGTRLWASYYGGSDDDKGYGCSVDGSGNVYLVGWTESGSNIASGGHQDTIRGGRDAFIVKFSSSGTRLWASYYGGSDFEEGYGCSVDGSGNVYLVGWTNSTNSIAFGGHQNTNGGIEDAFIVKFSSNGTRLWASYYGGTVRSRGNGCTVDAIGNVYLVGWTNSTDSIASGGHQNTFGGFFDAFIAKLEGCISAINIDVQTACDSFIWINGIIYTSSNDTAMYTIQNGVSNGCDSIIVLNLTITEIETDSINKGNCDGTEGGFINTSVTGGTLPYDFLWSNSESTANISGLIPGIYTLTLTDGNNCKKVKQYTITTPLVPVLSPFAGQPTVTDTTLDWNESILVDGGNDESANGVVYLWEETSALGNINFNDANAHSTTVSFNPLPGTSSLLLTATSADGCIDTGSVQIRITIEEFLGIPDAFTPNGDGINDFFRPANLDDYFILDFKIYNRWGQLIFDGRDTDKQWDGTLAGAAQNADVYVYLLRYQMPGRKEEILKGVFTLLR